MFPLLATVTYHYLVERLVITMQEILCRFTRGIHSPEIDINGGTAKIQYLTDLTLGGPLDKFSN